MAKVNDVVSGLHKKIGAARDEATYVVSLGSNWRERAGMVRFLALLYVARIMPFDTYHWTTTVRLRGSRFAVGVRTSEIYIVDEVYGGHMYDRLDAYVPRPGWTVVDLGANVGIFTVHAARQGASVYSFEPNPACFARLRANVEMNDSLDAVKLFNAGVSDVAGCGSMEVERGGTTGGTVARGEDGTIQLITLDEALAEETIEQIDLLKMDIEGAESSALRGAAKILTRTRRIIAEYHSRDLLEACEEILERNGFVADLTFVYYSEDDTQDGNEVGMLYAQRAVT